MKKEMRRVVPLRLNAEKDGKDEAEKVGVRGYPTVVFLNAAGAEVDRIVGYEGPRAYEKAIERIRSGDTWAAARDRLAGGDRDHALLERVVDGLMDRGRAEDAIVLVEKFHDGSVPPCCARRVLEARWQLQRGAYRQTERALLRGKGEPPAVSQEARAPRLAAFLARGDRQGLKPEAVAEALHEARAADTATLLDAAGEASADPTELEDLADIAFTGGHYERAAAYYAMALGDGSASEDANALNAAAWNLYLARVEPEKAVAWARRAYALKNEPGVADTLGHALYAAGKRDEAIKVQGEAVASAEKQKDGDADSYRKALEAMKAGGELDDAPPFESYPTVPKQPG